MKKTIIGLLCATLINPCYALNEEQCRSIEAIAKLSMEFRNMDLDKNIIKNMLYQKNTINNDLINMIVDTIYSPNIPKGWNPELVGKIFYKSCIN